MADLKNVLDYLRESSTTLQAGSLNQQDRFLCYVINNRISIAISLDNPMYKTMSDLMKESVISIREMREDVERMIRRKYKDVPLMEGVTFLDAVEELGRVDLDDYQNCITYLTDLALASLVSLEYNPNMQEEVKLVFNTLIYTAVVALNLFNKVNGAAPELEGVGISFDTKQKRAVYSS